ncbi:MAG: aminotransferase class V-fold PLP-dependent enzyme [Clostridiaceae bacterium]|nr:aminotransferase class V-fold PLP-dependent enzyme [Clostridiaceae bacterium]
MIYFDSAATTLQKPAIVHKAVESAMLSCGNPGRSGHKAAMYASKVVYDAREQIADFFGMNEPERVVFTCNATHALNIAIKSQLKDGGHVVISGYEHNSVARPLEAMPNVTYTVAHTPVFDSETAFEEITAAVREDTVCIITTHVSNVFGFVMPIERLDSFCGEKHIKLIIDASQSAGVLKINASDLKNTSFICMPGHKSLYGPQGTGILLCCNTDKLYSLMQGGTGSDSRSLIQPEMLPDLFESGTLNVCGIAGLAEGVKYITKRGLSEIEQCEKDLARRLVVKLRDIKGITVYYDRLNHCGPISITADNIPSEDLCGMLAEKGFCLRGGLHCSPLAHKSAGTLKEGTARVSFSIFNNVREVDLFALELKKIMSSQK